jgi:hypothetical protein
LSRTARAVPERCAGLVWHTGRFASAEPGEPDESCEPDEPDASCEPCEPDEPCDPDESYQPDESDESDD